jgi:hypothetical protein
MTISCNLDDIVDALQFQSEIHKYYLDTNTGEVIMLSDEEFNAVEDDEPIENYPEWHRELITLARLVLEDKLGRFVPLPTSFDIHEYSIMERFSRKYPDIGISQELCELIQGRGAFRRFKDAIHEYGIQDEWYKYKDAALVDIAKEWCEDHGIKYTLGDLND